MGDTDGDRYISYQELKYHLRSLSKEIVDFYMKILDISSNGVIDFPEFLEMYAYLTLHKKPNKTQMKQMFKALDKDNNGYISASEIKTACKMFSFDKSNEAVESKVDNIITSMDTNGDGRIDPNEFIDNYSIMEESV